MDQLFRRLKEEFEIKPEDCPIFFLYDRDFGSYKPNGLRRPYVRRYTDPYANDEGNQGQLLLSYPAVESYLLSCVEEDVFQQSCLLGKTLKPKLIEIGCSVERIQSEDHLIHATVEMDKGLEAFGLDGYDLDYLAPTLLAVYDGQQQRYAENQTFSLLSLISMALLELGIITACED